MADDLQTDKQTQGGPAPKSAGILGQLDERARAIFRDIVDTYLATGEPVGSRTISKLSETGLSPASIRNTMADLTELGLLEAPHVSAGRQPTHLGLRLFVDGLLEIGDVTPQERQAIEAQVSGAKAEDVLEQASKLLSGLARGAGLVLAPKRDLRLKHVEFVAINPHQTLVVMVQENGDVENRLIQNSAPIPASTLVEASNFLNARIVGRTVSDLRSLIAAEILSGQSQLDRTAARLIEDGVADWSGETAPEDRTLIVRGRANLLEDEDVLQDIERARQLFEDLERKRELVRILEATDEAAGVKLFIGAENPLFSLSGSSVIVAPYMNTERKVIGAVGVIGPTRINYARIIPMVDFTAQTVGRLLAQRSAPVRRQSQ